MTGRKMIAGGNPKRQAGVRVRELYCREHGRPAGWRGGAKSSGERKDVPHLVAVLRGVGGANGN
ncbi:MAG: hypothetical protein QW379_02745 [Thermoplasmata archaeon]